MECSLLYSYALHCNKFRVLRANSDHKPFQRCAAISQSQSSCISLQFTFKRGPQIEFFNILQVFTTRGLTWLLRGFFVMMKIIFFYGKINLYIVYTILQIVFLSLRCSKMFNIRILAPYLPDS